MLIGIDASRATIARRTGTENYSLQLIRHLVDLGSGHRFRLYFNQPPAPGLFPHKPHVELRPIPFPRLWTHVRLAAEIVTRPPDCLFIPAHVLPLVHPRRSIVTVHDLGYLYFPDAHRPFDRWYLDWSTRYNARSAAAVLADSQATRNDLVRHYGIDPAKITVVYPGLDPAFMDNPHPHPLSLWERGATFPSLPLGEGLGVSVCRSASSSRSRSSPLPLGEGLGVRAACHLPEPFILHVGTLQPRKNLARLIDAFDRARQRAAGDPRLTCAGLPLRGLGLVLAGRAGWYANELFRQVEVLGLTSRVHFLDYVPSDYLPALVRAAALFVMPSLYEGFGLPVLEAMACGTPVVCSNTSSLPEVAGDAALLVDPLDTDTLAEAIIRGLTDEPLRDELRTRGHARARHFTWDGAARQTLHVIEATNHA